MPDVTDAMSDERDGTAGEVLATEVDEVGPAPKEKMGIEAKEEMHLATAIIIKLVFTLI